MLADYADDYLWLAQPDGSFVVADVEFPNSMPFPMWRLPVSGDFNGDGRDDLLFSTGFIGPNFTRELVQWLSQEDGSFVEITAGATDSYWVVEGAGDFNGDGRTDILLRRVDNYLGQIDGWLVEWQAQPNGSFSGNSALTTWIHRNWHVAGTGDFDKDGRDDLLLRHDNGWLVEWLSQPDGSFSDNTAASNWIHPDWQVAGTGDFNNDGHDDVLLRHENGWLVEWLGQANGSFAENNAASTWLHHAWHVVAVADYNGDGHHDLLLRNDDGTMTNWLREADGTFAENGEAATYPYIYDVFMVEPNPFPSYFF